MARRTSFGPHRSAGFAYLWTLMLVAFMGVGLVIGSELYATSARRERERELLFIGHEFRNAIASYYTAPGAGPVNQYPLTLEDLLKDPRFPGTRRHLRRLYFDPSTGKAEWGLIRQQGRIVGVHPLSEKQPLKQDNFDENDAALRKKPRYADWLFTYPADLFTPQPDGKTLSTGAQPVPGAAPPASGTLPMRN
ncbi:type II secretion system protein [Oxalobacteraceae bacterium]|nr:type II secretion system protein [Oxalobacteraceae bacterium]